MLQYAKKKKSSRAGVNNVRVPHAEERSANPAWPKSLFCPLFKVLRYSRLSASVLGRENPERTTCVKAAVTRCFESVTFPSTKQDSGYVVLYFVGTSSPYLLPWYMQLSFAWTDVLVWTGLVWQCCGTVPLCSFTPYICSLRLLFLIEGEKYLMARLQ